MIERCSQLLRDESGTALTEFAITLPIFVFLLSALLVMGNLGISIASITPVAYHDMWVDAYDKSDGFALRNISPRGEALDAYDTVENIPGLDGLNPVDVIHTAGHLVTAAGGHWMESKAYTDFGFILSGGQVHYSQNNTDPAQRLQQHFGGGGAGWGSLTSSIIGDSVHRPKYALDDNIFDVDQNAINNFSGTSGIGGIVAASVGSLLELTGVVPGYLANVRYGSGRGWATSQSNLWGLEQEFHVQYSTALSPRAIDDQTIPGIDFQFGDVGGEQQQ